MDAQEEYLKLLFGCELEIRAFIGSIVRGPHHPDDVFQEQGRLDALEGVLPRYDRSRSFAAWARGDCLHEINAAARDKTKRLPIVLSPEAIQAVSSAFDRSEEMSSGKAEALERCLDQLPEKSRQLLSLRYERSLKIEQIAHELQATLDAVYQSLSRLRTRLLDCVNRRLSAGGAV